MSEFDKHWDEWAIASNCPEDEAKIHFEAGQQSKQAEIDVLKAKIDAIVSIVREADLSNGNSSVAIVHDEIMELLK